MKAPERMFKVVFVGDSGVGKSSIIYRFCHDSFKSTFSATIGVDFQIKTVQLETHLVAMQIWDTAGQERYYASGSRCARGPGLCLRQHPASVLLRSFRLQPLIGCGSLQGGVDLAMFADSSSLSKLSVSF